MHITAWIHNAQLGCTLPSLDVQVDIQAGPRASKGKAQLGCMLPSLGHVAQLGCTGALPSWAASIQAGVTSWMDVGQFGYTLSPYLELLVRL